MKRILMCVLSFTLCLALLFSFTACKQDSSAAGSIEGELRDIMDSIYENAGVEYPMHAESYLTDENVVYNIGTADVKYSEGIVSDAAIMTIPHSLVLIRAKSGSDIEKAKQNIRENIDPRKWICAGVEQENVIVDSIGDLIFVVMSENASAYHSSFLSLA